MVAKLMPHQTPNFNLRIPERGTTDMVYATVVAENVEALSGFEAISAVLHNSRKVIKDLQKFMLYGTCMIGNGILQAFAPND